MAKYVSIRGWIECEHNQVANIKKIITDYGNRIDFESPICQENVRLYNKGWCYQSATINWTSYIFYGADVKEYYLCFIEEEIREIVNRNFELEGIFFLDYEEGERKCWKISNFDIIEEKIVTDLGVKRGSNQ
ncbi:MAG: hypothetical protein K2M46_02955 [Lachnospiraceae bacterium]|nr:hypothetical protein [Lachnospiraceae bacterium]